MMEFTYSKHALERYVERMQEYDNKIDINVFIASRNSEIKERISKLIEYSTLIYTGKSTVDYNKEIVDVYLNRDGWSIVVDHNKNNVITLFKITLGMDEELDKLYLKRILEKYEEISKKREEDILSIDIHRKTYQELMEQNEQQINDLKAELKNLEKLQADYKEFVADLNIEQSKADKDLRSFVASILGKKVF